MKNPIKTKIKNEIYLLLEDIDDIMESGQYSAHGDERNDSDGSVARAVYKLTGEICKLVEKL